ncbi:MAG: MBL fold metallo-hydrolase [Anaerolineae bacterium]|nr:MBL fold metallo-hydrolase [Anaerolineae bacterium]
MKLTFHGAARTVTGSQHLLEVNGTRILLDCGLYQGKRDESRERNRHLPFDPSQLDAVILSHAHIDHSGNLPNVTRNGFTGDIICTFATRDLCSAMLRDSGHIQEQDVKYVNKKRSAKGQPPIEPLYTEEDAVKALKYFLSVGYDRPYHVASGVTVTFFDAGHMLGSAIVQLDIEDEASGQARRLVFSGDLGRRKTPILRDPTILDSADLLILESTYGGRKHDPLETAEGGLHDVIDRTYKRGGKVIIPAFAVGRTQTIVYELNRLYHAGMLPDIPVYVDSPLAVNATDIFRLHPDAFDAEAVDYLTRQDPDGDIFGFRRLRYIRQVEQSKELNDLQEPCIIISASGMMEAGRILHHLSHTIEDRRNTILIVGWQAPDTLGKQLIDKREVIRIFGEEYRPQAEVAVLNGFSGHADHGELLEWVSAFRKHPEKIFLVHGEVEAAEALSVSLKEQLRYQKVYIPELHQPFSV